MRKGTIASLVTGAAVALLGSALTADGVRAADHRDGPIFTSGGGAANPRFDLNDFYIFQSPADSANTVLILTASPMAGIMMPPDFATSTKYEILLDTDGDAVEDQTWSFTFGDYDAKGRQRVVLTTPVREKARGYTGQTVDIDGGGKFTAGIFDDPFFYDVVGGRDGFRFSREESRDFFRGMNTLAIVIEVPTALLGPMQNDTLGAWTRVEKNRKQVDRMARPFVNSILVDPANRDTFNATSPDKDVAKYKSGFVAMLQTAPFGRTAPEAGVLADALLPDVLTLDYGAPEGYPNGRRLQDDVADITLNMITGGNVSTDFVASTSAFRTVFPYLAAPNP